MRNDWITRLGLSLMVLVGMWTSRAPAQGVYIESMPGVLLMPATPYEPAHQPPMLMPLAQKNYPPPANHLVRRVLNNNGMGCTYDPYYAACVNWRYEFRFAFSSCRGFFGESCPPGSLCGQKMLPR